jgi:hypothetical protein
MKQVRAALLAVAFVLTLAPAAFGHTQTVAPPGLGEPVILNDPPLQGAGTCCLRGGFGRSCHFLAHSGAPLRSAILNPGGQSTGP